MAKKVVRVIPAKTKSKVSSQPLQFKKKRVAGYARVSTDKEEQETSYEAQVKYYTEYIKGRVDWEFVDIYTDEGISATSTAHREGFKKMVRDALDGKIDLIVTKSVSRFARNTVDSLKTIRELKEKGVEVYFEKENIWTLDAKGELLITIMSSMAQEESRSISENTTWGQRRRFAEGRGSVAYGQFLGYDKDFKVDKEQAKTVQLIYKLFLSGLTYNAIANKLEEENIPAPAGGKDWYSGTVKSILSNEKYKGDAILQKRYTTDFLTKKTVENDGTVVPKYYVEEHHEGIIDRDTFDFVQTEIERRDKQKYRGDSVFSSKLVCGECKGFYGRKVWHSNDKYRRVIWRCNKKYNNKKKCTTPHLTEDEIKDTFLKALNRLKEDREEVVENANLLLGMVSDTSGLEAELYVTEIELKELTDKAREIIDKNAHVTQDQEEYQKKFDELLNKQKEKELRYYEIIEQIDSANAKKKMLSDFIKQLKKAGTEVFDDIAWNVLVDKIIINKDGSREVVFVGGFKVKVKGQIKAKYTTSRKS